MAKNDIVLLDSLVAKSKAQFTVAKDESELFELFVFDQVLKDYDLSYDELEAGWTDGMHDGGVDGLFIHVDGRPATPDTPEYAARKSPTLAIDIFTVKHASGYEQQAIDQLLGSLAELLDLGVDRTDLKYPYNDDILEQRDLFSVVYIALADRQPSVTIRIHYCSRGDAAKIATPIQGRADALRGLLKDLFSNATVSFQFWGAAELLQMARRQRDFTLRLPFVETYISREGKNYILLCTLSAYYRFITDDGGQLRRYLFDSNVRDYLGEVLINRDIRDTLLRRDSPLVADFWWMNNGVTILGTNASIAGKELLIENVQIVNGLQTTETIFNHFSTLHNGKDERALLVKVILAADDDTRARIIKATNYQNTVDLASLRGLDKIQRDIEAYLADRGWFYDRRKNLYKNQGRPADRIVSIPYLAAAVRAIALGDPARSQRQRAKSLREDAVYSEVFDARWDLGVYLVSLEITRAIETALQTRRNVWDSPPIALVHFIGYVFVCESLKRPKYSPHDIVQLVGKPPSPEQVARISETLASASKQYHQPGRSYRGIKLHKGFIDHYVASMFTTQ